MLRDRLDNIRYKWNRLDIEDKIGIYTGTIILLILIQPIRQTIMIMCLVYLALYTIYKIYQEFKHKKK